MKFCRKCQEEKSDDLFGHSNQNRDGLKSYCKSCSNLIAKEHYSRNKEKVNEKKRKFYRQNSSKWKQTRKKYYEDNKGSYSERYKKYMSDPEKRARKNSNASKRDKERRKSDPNYQLKRNLRTRIWNALKGLYKTKKTTELIGCSIDELKTHLSSQWQSGMSWENYGKWHVDHIIPCSSFDLSDPKQQEECFHYSNLQPLWAKDNITKNNSIQKSCQSSPSP